MEKILILENHIIFVSESQFHKIFFGYMMHNESGML